MRYKLLLLIFLIVGFQFTVKSQNSYIDSLKVQKNITQDSEQLVDITISIANSYRRISTDSAVIYANQALELSNSINYSKGQGRSHSILGVIYLDRADNKLAIGHLNKALSIAEKHNIQNLIASTNNTLGVYYFYIKEYYKSFRHYNACLEVSRKLKHKAYMASSLQNIGIIYVENEYYEKGYSYIKESYEIAKTISNYPSINNYIHNLAGCLNELGRYDEAQKYLNIAISNAEKTNNNVSLAHAYNLNGNAYLRKSNLIEAEKSYVKSLEIGKELKLKQVVLEARFGLTQVYKVLADYDKAIYNGELTMELSDALGNKQVAYRTANLLFDTYDITNNSKKIIEYSRLYVAKKQALDEKKADAGFVKDQLDFELKELERKKNEEILLRQQERDNLERIENELAEKKLQKRNKLLVLAFTIFLMIVIGVILFKNKHLKHTLEELKASNEVKLSFLTKMSHEIKTPCNAIIGYSDLVLETSLTHTQKEFIETINISAYNLMEMFEDIIQVERLKTKKLQLYSQNMNLQSVTTSLFRIIESKIDPSKVSMKLDIDPAITDNVYLDKRKFQQILYNLCSNAVRFTAQGSINLKAQLTSESSTHYHITFSVKDTGTGINSADGDKIFEEFFQNESDFTRGSGNSGVGLTIVSELLKLMGSEIRFHSTPGAGSEFYFELSLAKAKAKTRSKLSDVNLTTVDIENQENCEIHILIVEDNSVNMILTKKLIKSTYKNAVIYEAENGKIGIEVFKANPIDLVLMDIQMPVLNGFEASAAIRTIQRSKYVPIIAYSAGLFRENKDKCKEVGIDDYIEKPINKNDFTSRLRIYVGKCVL